MKTPTDPQLLRDQIGAALRLARGDRSVHSTGASGLGYRTVDRLECGISEGVDLASVYLLALYYGVDLGEVLRLDQPPRVRADLKAWPKSAPSLPDTEAHVRQAFRSRRVPVMGTPTLAKTVSVHQPWIVRLESGGVSKIDLIRVARCCEVIGCRLIDLLPEPFGVPRERRSERRRSTGGRHFRTG